MSIWSEGGGVMEEEKLACYSSGSQTQPKKNKFQQIIKNSRPKFSSLYLISCIK